MAKLNRHVKAAKGNEVSAFERTEIFDDNLLPEAIEIEKLSQLDPEILTWLKERATIEQKFRHDSYTKRLVLTENHDKREHNTVRFGITIYFLLVFLCIIASYFLIMAGKTLEGSIFGGIGLVTGVAVLLVKKPVEKTR